MAHPGPPGYILLFFSHDLVALRLDARIIYIWLYILTSNALPRSPKPCELEYGPLVRNRYSMGSVLPPSPGPSLSASTAEQIPRPSRPALPFLPPAPVRAIPVAVTSMVQVAH